MSSPRAYADFQNLDDANRLRLTCAGTWQDLERQQIELRDGLRLPFYTDDADDDGNPDELLVDGVVHYDSVGQVWVATVDWQAVRHTSDEVKEPRAPRNGPDGSAPNAARRAGNPG